MSAIASPSEQISVELPSVQHTEYYAQHLACCLSSPMIITLSGDIGAGKTTLVRAMLRALGVQDPIKSPTYSLLETYDLPDNAHQFLMPVQCHHFDLYRIVDDSELEFMGFRDYFQPNTICCIEWPERAALPAEQIDLALLLINSESGRTLSIQANAKMGPLIHQCVKNFNVGNCC